MVDECFFIRRLSYAVGVCSSAHAALEDTLEHVRVPRLLLLPQVLLLIRSFCLKHTSLEKWGKEVPTPGDTWTHHKHVVAATQSLPEIHIRSAKTPLVWNTPARPPTTQVVGGLCSFHREKSTQTAGASNQPVW